MVSLSPGQRKAKSISVPLVANLSSTARVGKPTVVQLLLTGLVTPSCTLSMVNLFGMTQPTSLSISPST